MKKFDTMVMIIICGFLMAHGLQKMDHTAIPGVFPEIPGFQKKGLPETYAPENLFEYINGAAEVYLSYDFQELNTLGYENSSNQSISIDIYRHSNPDTGFGIYSQEKPTEGNFIRIGTQGYYESGVLNFFKDRYYVKLTGFDLGDQDRTLLEKTASTIEAKLGGEPVFPPVLSCFPEPGKIENSERYIRQNFLGHSFLHSAFICDYRINDNPLQVFIIKAASEADARAILENYDLFLKKKGAVLKPDGTGGYRFQDPYYRSRGSMNLKQLDRFIWGLFSEDAELSGTIINRIGQNLKSQKLVD